MGRHGQGCIPGAANRKNRVRGRTQGADDKSGGLARKAPTPVVEQTIARLHRRDSDPLGRRLSHIGAPPQPIVAASGTPQMPSSRLRLLFLFRFPSSAPPPEARVSACCRTSHALSREAGSRDSRCEARGHSSPLWACCTRWVTLAKAAASRLKCMGRPPVRWEN
mmetsp:Transcript_48280/g.79533  ORF Transcript_48280/g.79533 Transcript_48280/m.79533 type:complete len:165 (+) Transcript_48280:550-1044(+)